VKTKILIAILALPLFLFSQKKVDLDKFKFTCEFRSLPQIRLDSNYHTYNVVVEGTKLMRSYLDDLTPEKSVILDGWKMLDDEGHITVQVKLEDMLPESMSVKERIETTRDRNGKESTRKLYSQEVVYTFSAFADISDYKGEQLRHIVMADRGYKQVYRSPEFAIRAMAEGYFVINTLTVTGQLYKSCVNRAMRYLSERLTDDFGYGEVTVTDHMWIIDSRKHPEYAAHRNAFLTLKDVLFNISAEKPLDGIREELAPVINYFESIKKKYTSMSKHDRKIRYASYFNLAVLYYYLDDPQAMLREASGLVLNDFDARDGKGFETTAIRLKNLFEETKIYTRHFPIDISSFKGPNETRNTAIK
jgi:hypothetical protein